MKAESVTAPATRPDVVLSDAEVTLDWRRSEMEIRATAVRPPGPRPDTLWLWAYLTNPGISVRGSWSAAPIVVVRPFAAGDTARLAAVGRFDWTALGASPGRGYYARVFASTTSRAAAQIPVTERLEDSTGATRVTSP